MFSESTYSGWEKGSLLEEEDTEIDQRDERQEETSSGSYHSKSALRDHKSNMKLFLYRSSYNHLTKLERADPYDDRSLVLLSTLWRCFYHGTYDLYGRFDVHGAMTHSYPSTAYRGWTDRIFREIQSHGFVSEILGAEARSIYHAIWSDEDYLSQIHGIIFEKNKRLLYLVYFLNLCVLALNSKPSSKRPDIGAQIPGVSQTDDNTGIITVSYNDFYYLKIYNQCVRWIMPGYDQILQKDIFLTICDKINERWNVICSSIVIDNLHRVVNVASDERMNLVKTVGKLIDLGDTIVKEKKNRAFDLLSKFEAYCVSAILMKDDVRLWNNAEFQNNLLEDDRKESPDLYRYSLELVSFLNELEDSVLAEIHGLWRIWGHPIIDLEGGLKKMETTSLKKSNVCAKETKIGHRTMKLLMLQNYHKKHGHYPVCNFTTRKYFDMYKKYMTERDIKEWEDDKSKEMIDDSNYVKRQIIHDKTINDKHHMYRHADMDHVKLYQSFQIPSSMNLATMIKDKAISMNRGDLVESVRKRNTVFDSKKRRGILKWLSEQTFKVRDVMGYINDNGIPDDSLIIGLYPKERELKTKARFFSLMSYFIRMYVTITEELIGHYVLPYFPMITMSDDLLSMIIRLYNMTTNIGGNETSVTYSMNIDFSKWNQNMREKTNDPIFKTLDRFIGYRNLISRTHSIFKGCYLYLCSGEYIPTIIRDTLTTLSPYSRVGDESGKEGLRQKGWTITTVCDIISLAFQHNVKIELIGGGDNQVLTITIKTPNKLEDKDDEIQLLRIRSRMERFRTSLAKKMEKRGLPLKLEETWISHRLLMYNKIMYLNGVPLRSRLKVASRTFMNSNDGLMTLGSITSTLGTSFQSISSKDYTPIVAWVLSRILTLFNMSQFYMMNPVCGTRRLDKQILLSQQREREKTGLFGGDKGMPLIADSNDHTLSFEELMIICLYYHKILGGPGIGSIHSYALKSFPDPLSESLSMNYSIINNIRGMGLSDKITNVTVVKGSDVKHWEHLLEDPVSVNHDAPSHGIAALRNNAEKIMANADISNIKFKELINIGGNDKLTELSDILCEGSTIEPRLLHDIVGATIPGYVNTILSRVDQSTTLNKLATNVDVVYNIYLAEIKYYIYLANKIKNYSGMRMSKCPTEDARKLRDLTWEKKIVGVTTPHPSSFLATMTHYSSDTSCDHNYISVHVKRDKQRMDNVRGPFRPYFGSYTKEKFKQTTMASAYGDEDVLRRAIKIQKLLGWRYKEGTDMYNLIQGILRCVTDSSPSKFLPNLNELTGDVEHRYRDMATKHGGIPTNLIQYYTYASCNTSTFLDHSKGSANETLHFQASIIYSSCMAILSSLEDPYSSKMYHMHEECKECIKKIENITEDDMQLPRSVELMSCPSNSLIFVKEEEIPVHYHHIRRMLAADNHLSNDVKLTDIVERSTKCHSSFFLLLISNIMDEKTRLPLSSLTLMIEKLGIRQIIGVLNIWYRYYHLLMQKSPLHLHDGLDIMGFINDNVAQLKIFLTRRSVVVALEENKYSAVSFKDEDDFILSCSVLIRSSVSLSVSLTEWKDAIVRLQEPDYSRVKTMMSILDNPSLSTCTHCIAIFFENHSTNQVYSCSIHGAISAEFPIHNYSIERLSKMCTKKSLDMELEYERGDNRPADVEVSKKGKRKIGSLQELLNRGAAAKRIRVSDKEVKKGKWTDDMREFIIKTWTKTRVSSTSAPLSKIEGTHLSITRQEEGVLMDKRYREIIKITCSLYAVVFEECTSSCHAVINYKVCHYEDVRAYQYNFVDLYDSHEKIIDLYNLNDKRKSKCMFSCDIYSPYFQLSDWPYVIVMTKTSVVREYLSEDMLIDVIKDSTRQIPYEASLSLANFMMSSDSFMVTRSMIKSFNMGDIGITDATTLSMITTRLGRVIKDQAYMSNGKEDFNWKSLLSLRVLIGVLILSDSREREAMDHYIKYKYGFFKKGSYNNVYLFKSKLVINDNTRYFINGHEGMFGKKLIDVVSELKEWLYVSYKVDRVYTNVITL
ncbi:TPA_asm: L [Rhododendron delavayi virus 1]|uniref:RNA-directed RNA polymerase n=1 Tax=Rhododendron delavayi virus 1 TaxID=2793739 RepID=A0A8D9UIT7_9RHAB|nr:L [Rhododendron delavayi virus 1] [Rhododendron delavayi virus 1]DAF42308.1 TPA_asm: L [Rhododendron delavayi virus 1]